MMICLLFLYFCRCVSSLIESSKPIFLHLECCRVGILCLSVCLCARLLLLYMMNMLSFFYNNIVLFYCCWNIKKPKSSYGSEYNIYIYIPTQIV